MDNCMKDTAMIIGTKIRYARMKKGMEQRELAKAVGMSQAMLSCVETGKCIPTLRALYKIASALDVNADWFLNGELK